MSEEIHAIDVFEDTYMKQSVFELLQNGIRNRPELKAEIEKTYENKTIISDAEYMAKYAAIIAEMILPKNS